MFGTISRAARRITMATTAVGMFTSTAAGLGLAAAPTASADTFSVEYRVTIKDQDAKQIPRTYCPPTWYYLENKVYTSTPGWTVPNGVEVQADPGMEVNLEARSEKITNSDSWQSWAFGAKGVIANTTSDQKVVTITLHCTSEPRDGYLHSGPTA